MESGRGLYRDLEFAPPAGGPAGRPYLFINTVASVDGKTALEGKASGLGTAADRRVMRTLRSKADAVMVGGGTLRAERLALGLDAEDPRARPLGVILTNTGDVPLGRNLIRDPHQHVLVMLAEGAGVGAERKLRRLAEVKRVPEAGSKIDPAEALRILRAAYGVEILLCEGGPNLSRALISADLADELFVTLAPALIGQKASGAQHAPRSSTIHTSALRLVSAFPVAGEIFLRYYLNPHQPPARLR